MIFVKKFLILILLTASNVANSVKGRKVPGPVKIRRQILNHAIDRDFMVKNYNYRRAGIMSARRTIVGNADVRGVPPEACFAKFRWDNCGLPAQPVFYYYKPGSRCEIGFWRGCRPNPNMFSNEVECANTCIYTVRARSDGFDQSLSTDVDDGIRGGGSDGDGNGNRDGDGDKEKLLLANFDSGSDTDEQDTPGINLPDLSLLCATGAYHYEPTIGSCYRLSNKRLTWAEAAAECEADNAHLVVINSQAEHDVILRLLRAENKPYNDEFYFAGFRADVSVGDAPRVFKTIFNETLIEAGYNAWCLGGPTLVNAYCGVIHKWDAMFRDRWCHYTFYFICEKENN